MDSRLKRRLIAALGETIFYISAQEEDSQGNGNNGSHNIHTYIHTNIHTYIHSWISYIIKVPLYTYVYNTYKQTCVPFQITYIHTYMLFKHHIYVIHIYIHTWIYTVHTYILRYGRPGEVDSAVLCSGTSVEVFERRLGWDSATLRCKGITYIHTFIHTYIHGVFFYRVFMYVCRL